MQQQQMNSSGGLITVIHYTYSQGEGEDLIWRIACMPNMTEFHETPYHPSYQRSNDVRAVTCLACKRTQLFLENAKILETALRRVVGG